jgi:DNA invertase Pin-like site-specific DNA recombinase
MKAVAFYTVKQNDQNGLELQAQRAAVHALIGPSGGEVVAEFIELDKGRRSDWPELERAIRYTKDIEGTLVVTRFGRWVRKVSVTSLLIQSGINFCCCDTPDVNRETFHIVASLAANESTRSSERIRLALQAAKERGVKLGSAREGHWEGREDRRREGARKGLPIAVKAAAEARMMKALDAYSDLLPRILKMRDEERLTLSEIAKRVNAEGHQTSAGLPFTPTMIIRLLKRAGALKPLSKLPTPEPPDDFSDLPLFRQNESMACEKTDVLKTAPGSSTNSGPDQLIRATFDREMEASGA